MYKGNIINELIAEKGVKKNELLKYLGYSCYTQLRQIVEGNPSVTTLESVADFFKVPIDTFFERNIEGIDINKNPEVAKAKELKYQLQIEKERQNTLKSLLSEKDKQITLLEDMINILKSKVEVKQSDK